MNLRRVFLNKLVLAVVIVGALVGGALFWQREHKLTPEQQYKSEVVERGDVTKTVSANGTLNPVVLVNVGTQVSGTVKRLLADFNGKVQKGQVLAELDEALFMAQVRQSEANMQSASASLDLARINERRMRDLFQKEFVSQQELDQAVQALKAAEAQLALAKAQYQKDKTNLEYTVIRSPVSGVVVSREVDVGQTVAASFQTPTLFKIAQDLRKMQIDSSFAEADIGNIRVGQTVHFTVDAFPSKAFTGNVKQVRLNPATQQSVVTYDVVVAVSNSDQILMPGMTAYVNVVVAQRHDVLLIPNAALRFKPANVVVSRKNAREKQREDPTATVYVLESTGLRAVNIVTGISDNRRTEVVSGDLKAGDRVVVGEAQANTSDQSRSTFRMRMF